VILKIFSFIFLLIFNLYKNIVDTAVQFHGLLFFNHLNIAHILLYHSRSSLARKVQRENKVSGVLILNYIPIMNLKKKNPPVGWKTLHNDPLVSQDLSDLFCVDVMQEHYSR